jgi:tripartite ATP-independent transporter DctM subunit
VIGDVLNLLMFATVCGVLLAGFPVAFTLAGTAFAFALAGSAFGVFDLGLLGGLPSRYFGVMVNEILVAVPLFVFMGVVLERSKLAEDLLHTMGMLFGRRRGGLGLSVIFVGMLLAAATGIVGATVVTMGLLSLPTMLKAGYDPRLACGTICASGTLGQIIPPSIVLVLLGDVLQGANTQAQLALGNFAAEPVSVVDLFAGALLPGLMLVALYMVWQVIMAVVRPESSPALVGEGEERVPDLGRRVVRVLLPPAALIVAVLGSIVAGIATPTESAAVGAVGAMTLAAVHKRLTLEVLRDVMRTTTRISSMVFVILLGASVFSLVFRGLGGDELVSEFLRSLPGGAFAAMVLVMGVMFLLGFVGLDPVWLGVMIGVNLQTSFLTPPFGFALFYLRGVAPASIATADIYRGVAPFVAIQILGLILLAVFPALATWLPDALF